MTLLVAALLGTALFTGPVQAAETQKTGIQEGETQKVLLHDSKGMKNGAAFAVYEVGDYYARLLQSGLSEKNAQEKVLTAEAARDPDPDIHFVEKEVTRTGTYTDVEGTHTEAGLLEMNLPVLTGGRDAMYLIKSIDDVSSVVAGSAHILVLPEYLHTEDDVLHIYAKRFTPTREPTFRKMGRNHDGTTRPLKDAEFVLFQSNGEDTYYLSAAATSTAEWVKEETNDRLQLLESTAIKKFSSGAEGVVDISLGLPPGTYYFREVKAPIGYDISEEASHVVMEIPAGPEAAITINGQTLAAGAENDELPIVYDNELVGEKRFRKVDAAQEDHGLADAKFIVANADGRYLTTEETWKAKPDNSNTGFYIVTSDQDGYFTINNLPYGDYSLHEITAPKGYVLPNDFTVGFTIDEVSGKEGEYLKIVNKEQTVPNEPGKPGRSTPTKTGDDVRRILLPLVIVLLAGGVTVMVLHKRTHKRNGGENK